MFVQLRQRRTFRQLLAAAAVLLACAPAAATRFRCADVFGEDPWPSRGFALTPLKETKRTSPFIQVAPGKTVNLSRRFGTYFEEGFSSYVIDKTAHTKDTVIKGLNMGLIVQRDALTDPEGVEMAYTPIRPHAIFENKKILLSTVVRAQKEIFDQLYESYGRQGPEVAGGLDRYRRQDDEKRARTTHFILTDTKRTPVAHLQALQKAKGLLNVEDEFSFRIKGSERIFELGRFRILDDQRTADIARRYGGDPRDRQVLQLILYQKMFGWLNNDAKADASVMYVNEAMRRVLQHKDSPFRFDQVVRLAESKDKEKEYALILGRENMLRTEENVVRALLLRRLRYALTAHADPFLEIYFRPNERPVLFRLGLLSQKNDGTDFLRASAPRAMENDKAASLGLDRLGILSAIELLENQRPLS